MTDLNTCRLIIHEPAIFASIEGDAQAMYFHWYNDFLFGLFAMLHDERFFAGGHFHLIVSMARAQFKPMLHLFSRFCPREARELPDGACFCQSALNSRPVLGGFTKRDLRNFILKSFGAYDQLKANAAPPRLCVISRTMKRFLLNEHELLDTAASMGVNAVRLPLEEMTFYEQISSLRQCTMLIGVHGSGLVNSMFLREGAIVLQVIPYGVQTGDASSFFHPFLSTAQADYRMWVNSYLNHTVMHWHFADEALRLQLHGKPDALAQATGSLTAGRGRFFGFWINQDTRVPHAEFVKWVRLARDLPRTAKR